MIYLDLDGVLVNFIYSLLYDLGKVYPEEHEGKWFYGEELGITDEEFWAPTVGKPRWWADLPWMPDGQAIFKTVRSFAVENNLKLKILTHPSNDPASWAGKAMWANNNNLLQDMVMTLDKSCIAKPGDILIDDSDTNVGLWSEAGGSAILVPRRWNSLYQERDQSMPEYILKALRRLTFE